MNRLNQRIRTRAIGLAMALLILSPSYAFAMNAVYVQSNASTSNEVALLTQDSAGKPLEYIESYSTTGIGEPAINGNQAHALASDGGHLFVTNAGDDSISSFLVGKAGRLTLITKTSALGRHPTSLAVIRDNLIVLNQGEAGNLSQINPSIQRFQILKDGTLKALRGRYTYLPNDVPVDVIGNSKGDQFNVILEGLSQIDTFNIGSKGSISRSGSTGGISNPLGSAMGRLNPHKLAVTLSDETLPGVASLLLGRNGKSQQIFQSVNYELLDPCWAVANSKSTLLWTSAFKTRTVSLYRWDIQGNVTYISSLRAEAGGPGGLDLAISQNDKNLFWLRVDNVEDDTLPTRPYIDSFLINPSSYSGTAGLTLISKTWLPVHWSTAKATGILSIQLLH